MRTTRFKVASWLLPACLAASALSACNNEQGLRERAFKNIAVATGDFDEVEATLTRLDIAHTNYEGFIARAVYDPEINPDGNALKTEALFTAESEGVPEIEIYDAVFVNSGTRGLGAFVYNGTEADDGLVTDQTALTHVRDYVENGGTLVVSDWSYDLIEALWPDELDFVRDDLVLDDAQRGTSSSVVADVLDTTLAEALDGNQTLELGYDYTYWSVIDTVAPDVTVYLSGDITYRASGAEGEVAKEDAPLLVGFTAGGGQVLFSTFHWRAQRNAVSEGILLTLIEGLKTGPNAAEGSI